MVFPITDPTQDPRIAPELRDDERVLWADRPVPRAFNKATVSAVLFSIPFTGFAVFWIAGAAGLIGGMGGPGQGGPGPSGGVMGTVFPLFGLPFVLVGLGMMSTPIWYRRRLKKSLYAITDRRAIIWQGAVFGGTQVSSHWAKDLAVLERRQRSDGSGDLVFERREKRWRDGDGDARRSVQEVGFMSVPNVREVERALHDHLIDPHAR
ncbi:MAG: hypothetical protein AAFX79_13350 [Planctomycetota bacterium]